MKTTISTILMLAAVLSACAAPLSSPKSLGGPSGGVEVVAQSETVSTFPLSGTPGAVEVRGGDEAALREFIGRVLNYGGVQGGSTVVLVGELPNSLPFSLPIPDGATVLGSVVHEDPDSGSTELYLDADLSPEKTIEFYRVQLAGDEWSEPEGASSSAGFVSEPFVSGNFCHGPTQAGLWVSAFSTIEGTTDLRLNVQRPNEYSICKQDYSQGYVDRVQQIMPTLASPPGSQVQTGGLSSSGTEGTMSATVNTSLSPSELLAYYDQQLEDSGWRRSGSESSDEAAWSFWTTETKEAQTWIGTLLLFQSHLHPDELLSWFVVELE